MDHTYWQKQSTTAPLFPDIQWAKPEQKSRSGRLAIIGGNKLGFIAVRDAYEVASSLGVGQIRAILPDALRSTIPSQFSDAIFVPSNPSGGFSREAKAEFMAACQWADICVLVGDSGKNSETAVTIEALLATDTRLVITRDAVDLLRPAAMRMVERAETTLVVSFAQLQKLFQAIYYPRVLSFSMPLMQLVEALHKFTITYPCTVVVFHQNQLIVAVGGQVSTTEWDEPMMIWRGITATRAASYMLWSPSKPFEAITTSLIT